MATGAVVSYLENKGDNHETRDLGISLCVSLSSTFALAYTNPNHHRSGARTHGGAVGMSYAPTYGGRMNYGGCRDNGGYLDGWCGDGGTYGFGPNNRPGLVGGDDSGT